MNDANYDPEIDRLKRLCKSCALSDWPFDRCNRFYEGVQVAGTGNKNCWHPKGTIFIWGEQDESGV